MDKAKAIARLDAIEAEAKELRKVIEGKVTFDGDKLYVAILGERPLRSIPFILAGRPDGRHHFHSFQDCQDVWDGGPSGQDAINSVISRNGTVHEFTDTRTALQFFLDNLKD